MKFPEMTSVVECSFLVLMILIGYPSGVDVSTNISNDNIQVQNFSTSGLASVSETSPVKEITAVDNYGKSLNSSAEINIKVDVSNEAPYFSQRVYNFNISEKLVLAGTVGYVKAYVNSSVGGFPIYTLDGSNLFYIDPEEGKIQVIGNLARENKDTYNFDVFACDEGAPCGSATVNIHVTDTFKCPAWNMKTQYLSIQQGFFGQMVPQDGDLAAARSVKYYMYDTSNQKISVSTTGKITLLTSLKADTSGPNAFNFSVYAEDDGTPPCIQNGTLQITVVDHNDNYPVISYNGQRGISEIKVTVYNHSPAGTLVALVHVLDSVTSLNKEVTLNLTNKDGRASDWFSVSDKGVILLKKDVNLTILQDTGLTQDNETVKLVLWATDKGQKPKSTNATIEVLIAEPPIGAPVFTQLNYTLAVKENEPADSYVGVVATATNASLHYSIVTGGVPFKINRDNGTILTTTDLDKESVDSYVFIVRANDTDKPGLFSTVLVMVNVEDVNEPPKFENQLIEVTGEENKAPFVLGTVIARDIDVGTNGNITYSFVNASVYQNFSLDETTGVLSVTQPLDRETTPSYDLIVQAKKDGNPQLTATATVHVIVTDVNDNAPIFSPSVYHWNISKSDSSVQAMNVTAKDADEGLNKIIIYSLTSSFRTFKMDPLTGEIKVFAIPSEKNYTLEVQAHDLDSPSLNSTATVRVAVTEGGVHGTTSLAPNSVTPFVGRTTGTQLPGNIIRTVAEGGVHGTTSGVHGTTSKVHGTTSLSLAPNSITPFVGRRTGTQLPVNNTTTVTEGGVHGVQSLSLAPNSVTLFVGMTAGTQLPVNITTTDVNSLHISGGNGTDIFILKNGQIYLNQTLTKETVYALNVDVPSVTRELEIIVLLLKFDQQLYEVDIQENIDVQQCILDMDSRAEQLGYPVVYSLTVYDPAFSINSSSGELYVRHALDREEAQEHVLNISLHLENPHSRQIRAIEVLYEAIASVIVRVQDQNDNVPSFGSLSEGLLLSVPEDVNATYIITTLKATDPDEGLNGDIYYSISDGRSDVFSINEYGELRVASPEKLKDQYFMSITVRATDMNGTGNFTSLNVKIFIVKDRCQFRLPTPLTVSSLAENSQDIIKELSTILGVGVSLDGLMAHNKTGDADPDKSDLLLRVCQKDMDAGPDSIGLIGERISEKQGEIASMFKGVSQGLSESGDDTLSTTAIALIAVSCGLFLIALVAIICVCRLRKRLHRRSLTEWDDENQANSKRENKHSNNGSVKETSSLSDLGEHIEMSRSAWKEMTEKSLMDEEQEQTFNFDLETKSLGWNTVARRDHAIDLQFQKMQQLFQALVGEEINSEMALLANKHSEGDMQDSPSSPSSKQNVDFHPVNSLSSKPIETKTALLQSSDPEVSKVKLQDKVISTATSASSTKSKLDDNAVSSKPTETKAAVPQSSVPEASKVKLQDKVINTATSVSSTKSKLDDNSVSSKLTETKAAVPQSSDPEVSKVKLQDKVINTATSVSSTKSKLDDNSVSSKLTETKAAVPQSSDPEVSKVKLQNEAINTATTVSNAIPNPDSLNEDVHSSNEEDTQDSDEEMTHF